MLFLISLLIVVPRVIVGVTLCTTKTVGEADPAGNNATLAGTTNYNYAIKTYKFDCCGLVTGWTAYISTTGTVRFQVLRPSGSNYKVVGENVVNFGTADQANKEQSYSVSTGSQISVQENDIIGWYTAQDQIPYSASSTNDNVGKSIAAPSVGSSISFSGGDLLNGRTYAINAKVAANNPPTFTNLPQAAAVEELDNAPKLNLFLVQGEDKDPQDTFTITQLTTATAITYNAATKYVTSISKAQWIVGVYSIDLKIEDDCGNSKTESVKVEIKNTPPDITNLPNTNQAVSIKEDVSTLTKLFALTVTDVQTFTCSYAGTEPFTVQYDSGAAIREFRDSKNDVVKVQLSHLPVIVTSYLDVKNMTSQSPKGGTIGSFRNEELSALDEWAVYYKGYTTSADKLNFNTKSQYILAITCEDDLKDAATSTTTKNIIIDVLENKKPTITNMPATKTISAATVKQNDLIFTVTGNDVDSSPIHYNMTCTPSATCPFKILTDGKIVATTDLTLHKVADYKINAYAYDDKSVSDAGVLDITITDINDVPEISNIPSGLKKTIDENSNIGTVILDVDVTDGNPGDTHTFTATFSNGGDEYFEIVPGDGKIKTKADLNYEDLLDKGVTTFTVGVQADDTKEKSTVKYFTITVNDVNEPQTGFTETQYEITTATEIPSSFKNILTLVDPDDTRDTQTYTMDCGTKYGGIKIDPKTAEISWSGQVDLDAPALQTDDIICKVTATDKGNHKAETEVKITVTEINDNDPELDKTIYTYSIPINTPPGSGFGAFTVTDKDVKAENKKSTYTLTGANEFDVQDCCSFVTSADLTKYSVGKTFEMDLTATNTKTGITDAGGSTTRKTTAKVQVILTDPTTTTTTTTAATPANLNLGLGGSGGSVSGTGSFLDDPENLGWFIPTMIALAGMLALLAYMIWRILRNPGFFSNLNLCKGLGNNRFKGFNCTDTCCKKTSKKTSPKLPKVKDPAKLPGKYEWNVWATSDFANKTVELR